MEPICNITDFLEPEFGVDLGEDVLGSFFNQVIFALSRAVSDESFGPFSAASHNLFPLECWVVGKTVVLRPISTAGFRGWWQGYHFAFVRKLG